MVDLKRFLIPWIDDITPYDTEDLLMAWSRPELKRMMINENPLPPSEKILEAVVAAAKLGNRYPNNGPKLRARIAKQYDLGPENVYISHGSSEIIDIMMRLFVTPGDEVLLPNPTFSLYGIRAKTCGGKVVPVDMTPDLQYDIPAMLQAVTPRTKVLIICTPNNPTGDFISDQDLMRIVELGLPTLIDEAYLEYHPERESRAPLIRKYNHLIVSHTFSKAYGLAGIRFGYALADEKMIQYFRKVQIPWNTSLLSMAAAEAALDEEDELKRKAAYNNAGVDYVCKELSKILGVKPYYSHGNYVMVDATDTGVTGKEIVDYVFEKDGVMLKAFSPLRGRGGFFRISIGTHEENSICIQAIKQFFKNYEKEKKA
ncbi:MAG: histidinol-phosphate transaminase [Deltaproteobacteria bacterium RBG_16_48_10]|nr:MAG: histidinol-phosphate transaminase [Deltaproteobacteria bacterium RBG_16_48_10]